MTFAIVLVAASCSPALNSVLPVLLSSHLRCVFLSTGLLCEASLVAGAKSKVAAAVYVLGLAGFSWLAVTFWLLQLASARLYLFSAVPQLPQQAEHK